MTNEILLNYFESRNFFIVKKVDELKAFYSLIGIHGIAIDLDETVSDAGKYWVEYLTTRLGNPENLTLAEIRQKYGYLQNYWKSPEALVYVEELRKNNTIQENLEVIPDADRAVRELDSTIPVGLYATNRPTQVMNGTIRWLGEHCFPPAPVIARPFGMPYEQGNVWKAGTLEYLYPFIQGIVDNDPNLVTSFSSSYRGTVYLFGQTESPRDDINVIPCLTWVDLLEKIK